MSGLTELSLTPAVAGVLESFGLGATDAAVRDVVPPAARGTNLALACPPAARYAVPALAGLVSHLTQTDRQALILVPSHALDEWAAVLLPLSRLPACRPPAPGNPPAPPGGSGRAGSASSLPPPTPPSRCSNGARSRPSDSAMWCCAGPSSSPTTRPSPR